MGLSIGLDLEIQNIPSDPLGKFGKQTSPAALACLTCEFVLIAGLFMCSCTYKKKSTNNKIVQSCQKCYELFLKN